MAGSFVAIPRIVRGDGSSVGVADRLEEARKRAQDIYPGSRAYQGVYVKGAIARAMQHKRSSCPYERTARRSWANTWRSVWLQGYDSA